MYLDYKYTTYKNMRNKNFFKFVLTLLIANVFAINSAFVTNATDNNTHNNAIKFLQKTGMSQEIIEKLDSNEIEHLYSKYGNENNIKFSGYNEELINIAETNMSKENIETYGNIPSTQLSMSIVAFDRISNGKVSNVIVEMLYEWIKAPFFTLTDAMTFNWDSTLFSLGGFYAESGYDTRDITFRYQWKQSDYIDRPATGVLGGIGWYLKTSLGVVGSSVTVDSNNKGSANVLLVPKSTIYTSTKLNSNMYFKYAHQIAGTSISFGVSETGANAGVSFSAGKYDEAATYMIYH